MRRAKQQAQVVTSIKISGRNAQQVSANAASETYFDIDGWNMKLIDPEPSQRFTLEVDELEMLSNYYQSVTEFIGLSQETDSPNSPMWAGRDYRFYRDDALDISVGVDSQIASQDWSNEELALLSV